MLSFRKWKKIKKEEWRKNAQFWIKILSQKLDPFREEITHKAILKFFKNKKKLKVLELGCGEGTLSRKVAKMGHQVFALDQAEKLIEKAKKEEEKKPLGIKYFCKDATDLSFLPKNFFDIVFSHHFINEVLIPEKVIKETRKVLKKKGEMISLFLHPCFDLFSKKLKEKFNIIAYFSKKILKRKFLVSGILSPADVTYIHLPLEKWISIFSKNGFLIKNIFEPHPSLKKLKENKFFRENFEYPLFILIEAVKNN